MYFIQYNKLSFKLSMDGEQFTKDGVKPTNVKSRSPTNANSNYYEALEWQREAITANSRISCNFLMMGGGKMFLEVCKGQI